MKLPVLCSGSGVQCIAEMAEPRRARAEFSAMEVALRRNRDANLHKLSAF
jgi:hypothetical protein